MEEIGIKSSKNRTLKHFFSVDSDMSIQTQQESPKFLHNYCSKEFILKIIQVVINNKCNFNNTLFDIA